MILDNTLIFSSAQLLTASAASTSTVDLTGGTLFNGGNFPTGQAFGEDLGVGDGVNVPKVYFGIVTAFTTCTSVNFQIQGNDAWTAPAGWTTYAESGAVPIASLVAGAQWQIDLPRRIFGARLPAELRVYYTLAGGAETTGSVNSGIALVYGVHTDGGAYPSNYVVAG